MTAGLAPAQSWNTRLNSKSMQKAPDVAVQLVADQSHIVPGESFLIGVLIDIPEPWHIYWINPGDTGTATVVEFDTPEGLQVGPLRYPAPQRYEGSGELVDNVYFDQVMLWARVDVASDLDVKSAQKLQITARVDWLACHKVCHEGHETVETTLPVGSLGDVQSTHSELFQDYRDRTPVQLSTYSAPAALADSRLMFGEDGNTITVNLDVSLKNSHLNPELDPQKNIQVFGAAPEGWLVKNLRYDFPMNQRDVTTVQAHVTFAPMRKPRSVSQNWFAKQWSHPDLGLVVSYENQQGKRTGLVLKPRKKGQKSRPIFRTE